MGAQPGFDGVRDELAHHLVRARVVIWVQPVATRPVVEVQAAVRMVLELLRVRAERRDDGNAVGLLQLEYLGRHEVLSPQVQPVERPALRLRPVQQRTAKEGGARPRLGHVLRTVVPTHAVQPWRRRVQRLDNLPREGCLLCLATALDLARGRGSTDQLRKNRAGAAALPAYLLPVTKLLSKAGAARVNTRPAWGLLFRGSSPVWHTPKSVKTTAGGGAQEVSSSRSSRS